MGLVAVTEFMFVTWAAIGAINEKHGSCLEDQ
jgi:hypothetical protein